MRKRSAPGTIELLLTSPLTDLQIVIGKFLGGLVLYARDAGASRWSTWRFCSPSATPSGARSPPAYLGLLLMGGCFLSLGLFVSSLTKQPDRRRAW